MITKEHEQLLKEQAKKIADKYISRSVPVKPHKAKVLVIKAKHWKRPLPKT